MGKVDSCLQSAETFYDRDAIDLFKGKQSFTANESIDGADRICRILQYMGGIELS